MDGWNANFYNTLIDNNTCCAYAQLFYKKPQHCAAAQDTYFLLLLVIARSRPRNPRGARMHMTRIAIDSPP